MGSWRVLRASDQGESSPSILYADVEGPEGRRRLGSEQPYSATGCQSLQTSRQVMNICFYKKTYLINYIYAKVLPGHSSSALRSRSVTSHARP